MDQALVSIVMPAYNVEKYIRKAIDSILNQSYSNFELIIADDCSTDSTRIIIDEYTDPRIIKTHNKKNEGYLLTCNRLLTLTKGDFITFQDSDDWSTPDRIEKQLNAFKNDQTLGACATNCVKTDSDGNNIETTNFPLNYNEIKEQLESKVPFCCASVMFTRNVYNTVGGYHTFFNRIGSEDLYWIGLIVEKFKTITLPDHLYYYRQHPGGVSRKIDSVRKLYSGELAKFLLRERKKNGTDSLESGIKKPLTLFEAKQKMKTYYWNDDFFNGFKAALNLIVLAPLNSKEAYTFTYSYFIKWVKSLG